MLAPCHMIYQLCVTMVTISTQTKEERKWRWHFVVSESHSYTFTEHTHIRQQQQEQTVVCCVNRQHIKRETEMESSYTQNFNRQNNPVWKNCGASKPQIIWYYVCIFVCVCVHNVINASRWADENMKCFACISLQTLLERYIWMFSGHSKK